VQHMNRRKVFKLAGLGSAVAAGAALPIVGLPALERMDQFGFRASIGLPEAPLPSYATYVVQGTLDLMNGTGLITGRVLAGHPDAQSEIGLPGLTRVIRVLGVDHRESQLTVRGVVEDRSQLQPGESAQVEIIIDRQHGMVQAPLGGRTVTLNMI
jgi:hypothetical protein